MGAVCVSVCMQNKLQATRRWLWILKSRSAASPAAIETSRFWLGSANGGGSSRARKRKTQATNSLLARGNWPIRRHFHCDRRFCHSILLSQFFCFFYFFRATTTLDWNRKCWQRPHRRQHLQIQFKFEPFRHASFTWHACKFCAKHIKHGQTAIKNKSK